MHASIGKIKYLKHNPNAFELDVAHMTGHQFEESIYRLILKELSNYHDICRAIKTPRSRDRGKDVIVTFVDNFCLFGINFHLPRDETTGRMHIEIKKKNSGSLAPNEFGGSLVQSDADGIKPNYFLLVTSSYLSPNTAYYAQQELNKVGTEFFIVDRHRLSHLFEDHKVSFLGDYGTPPKIEPVNISYCLQNEDRFDTIWEDSPQSITSQKKFYLYVKMQNYDSNEHIIDVNLHSDINWDLSSTLDTDTDLCSPNSLRLFLPGFSTKCKKLRLEQVSLDAIEELRIAISIDDSHHTVKITSHNLNFEFDPPLFGKEHNKLKFEILNRLELEVPVRLIELHGIAGTGKSKLLNEVKRLSEGTNKHFVMREIRRENETYALSSVLSEIVKQENIERDLPKGISVKRFKIELTALSKKIFRHYVIVLEDMHHASKELLTLLKTIASGKEEYLKKITLIFTGRDDDTFANEHYYSFIDHITQQVQLNLTNENSALFQIKLHSWSNEDSIKFIKHTVIDIPDFVVERIKDLSENTPFGTIQSIQYLLDLKIVEVVNRNTVGVLNAESFAAKVYIPSGIEELLKLRAENLVIHYSDRVIPYLSALAYLGMENQRSIVLKLMEDEFEYNLISDLCDRRLLDISEQGVKFYHENLQTYFLNLLEKDEVGKEAALKLLLNIEIRNLLDKHQQGYLFFLSKQYEIAFNYFTDIWSKISSSSADNISSIDIPKNYFIYFLPLIVIAIKLKKNPTIIQKICTIEVYTALHNMPLALALKISNRNLKIMRELNLQMVDDQKYLIKVEQLKAHTLLNMGFIKPAQKIMLEIATQAKLDQDISKDSALMFDVYDRLQNIYHQFNHLEQFKQYSDLSSQIANKISNKKMLSLVYSSRVKEHYYSNPEKFYKDTLEATNNALDKASKRHICHSKLNLYIAELVFFHKKREKIKNSIKSILENLHCATKNGYSFSITRSQLSLATAFCLLGLDDTNNRVNAEKYVNYGIESGLRYGNGFFHWQLHNIKAIIEMNHPACDNQTVAGHFETALSYLKRQGLLFIGALDSLSPNLSVISNVIYFYDNHIGDKETYNLVRKLTFYDKGMKSEKEEVIDLIKNLRKYKLIGRRTNLPFPFIEPSSGYFLAVR